MQGFTWSSINNALGTFCDAVEKRTEKTMEQLVTIGNVADEFINATLDISTGTEAEGAGQAESGQPGAAAHSPSSQLPVASPAGKQHRAWDENAWEDMGDDWGDDGDQDESNEQQSTAQVSKPCFRVTRL